MSAQLFLLPSINLFSLLCPGSTRSASLLEQIVGLPLFFSPSHNLIRSHLHQPQRAVPSLTLNSMIITLAQFNPVEVCGKGYFFVSCIGSHPHRPPIRRLPMPYMKMGETVGANHAFIGQEQAFVKAQRARMEEDIQRTKYAMLEHP